MKDRYLNENKEKHTVNKLPGKLDEKGWAKVFRKGIKIRSSCPNCGFVREEKIKYGNRIPGIILCCTVALAPVGFALLGIASARNKAAVSAMKQGRLYRKRGQKDFICPQCKDAELEYTIIEVPKWQ